MSLSARLGVNTARQLPFIFEVYPATSKPGLFLLAYASRFPKPVGNGDEEGTV
jgi:hypothetical protein